ncbi:exodeoxyribonuclease III [Methanothrix sp.]|uniref:exodeoxyribonuclease III n=1 Tax=Methanothrix sp. TaxID=90426 RepID=UPI003BB7F32F
MPSMRILSWNVNGLRAIYKKGFVDWLFKDRPDVLCLQEIKATEDQIPKELKGLPGYISFFSPGARKGRDGVALFTKTEPLSLKYSLGLPGFDDEQRAIVADYGDFLLFNVYFPNGKASKERLSYKMRFYDLFLDLMDQLVAEGREIVICGDVNTAHKEIDLARPKPNEKISGFLPEERAWIDRLIEHGFLDTFRLFHPEGEKYSFWDMKTRARERNVGWRIDYFFVSLRMRDRVKSAFILDDVYGSDHCPVGLEIELYGRNRSR